MTEFEPEKFEERYVHYFEELERAYSNAYQQIHGETDSEVLRAMDRQVLNKSEPVYEGDGQFPVTLPDDIVCRDCCMSTVCGCQAYKSGRHSGRSGRHR